MLTQTEIERFSMPMLAVSNSTKQLMSFKARVMTCFTQAEAAMCFAMDPVQNLQPKILAQL